MPDTHIRYDAFQTSGKHPSKNTSPVQTVQLILKSTIIQWAFQQGNFLLMLKQINDGFDNAIKDYTGFGKRD